MKSKKIIIALAALCCALLPAAAEANNAGGHKESSLSYKMAPVYKVMESRDAYVVIYGRYGSKLATAKIPKEWAKYKPDTTRKLTIRSLPPKLNPYITVVKKDGEFHKVILTVPSNKNDTVWGTASNSKVDASGVESIELEN